MCTAAVARRYISVLRFSCWGGGSKEFQATAIVVVAAASLAVACV